MTVPERSDRGLAAGPVILVLLVAAVAGVAVGGMAMADDGPSGEQILNETADRYAEADTVVGEATVTVDNGTATETATVAFAAAADNRTRVSVTGDDRTVVLGSNGSVAWTHLPDADVTRVYEKGERPSAEERSARGDGSVEKRLNATQRATLRAAANDWSRENATVERVGTATVDGTEAHVIEVRPADGDAVVTYWIATGEYELLRLEVAGEDGTVTVDVTETRFDVSVADSTFEPPTDDAAELGSYDTRAALSDATDLPLPTAEGYTFESGTVATVRGNVTAVQRYTGPADVQVVSTAATTLPTRAENASEVDLGGTTGSVATGEDRVVVTWTDGDTRFAVIGSADDREAVVDLARALAGQN